jgi:PIN domain nuclease of toxin-antitoxin system
MLFKYSLLLLLSTLPLSLTSARFYRQQAQYGNTQYLQLGQQCKADNAELEDNDHIDPQSRVYQTIQNNILENKTILIPFKNPV